jgi:AraC-like DNA-binding protein
MPIVQRAPHPALARHVSSYYGFSEETGATTRRREGPDAAVVVVISFGNEWRIGDARDPAGPLDRHTSFVAGLHDGAVLTEHDGRAAGMQVNLEAPAAGRLLGVPMHELARRTVPLDALFGAEADRLVERLHDLDSWNTRFDLLERTLAARLAASRPPSPEVAWAWERLRDTGGRVRVSALADELRWSRPRLVRRFREEVGLPPKAIARLRRFERVIELLERTPAPGWAEIAASCGYFDQSHLVNECRAITGTTPTAFAADRAA